MTYAQKLKRGTSLCFTHSAEYEALKTLHDAGIDCVEFSFNFDTYMNKMNFPECAEEYAAAAKEIGIELWSIHLPFSRKLDISSADDGQRELILDTNKKLIAAAGRAGFRVAVLHPSSEPITDEDRPSRLARSREGIIMLREAADAAGIALAVENLPRTCLCNRSGEMIDLIKGTGADIVFDTNHSLIEENVAFLSALAASGIKIRTLHISDYDFVDERHRLPGDGLNNWAGILSVLEGVGYDGPLMYEVPDIPKEREKISVDELVANMKALAAGEISRFFS